MALTAAEQYLVELINRARLDPNGEAKRQGISLNKDLGAGTITGSSKEVLAVNSKLNDAAHDHSKWILDTDTFSHTGANGSNPGARMLAAGYSWNSYRENLDLKGSTGSINLNSLISQHHDSLFDSETHRVNIFEEKVNEIGVGQVEGRFTQGSTFNTSVLTEKLGNAGDTFVTGVAFKDANKNNFYNIGEGFGGVKVVSGTNADTAASTGGFAVEVGQSKTTKIEVKQSGKTLAKFQIDTSDGNAKFDVVKVNGNFRYLTSEDLTIMSLGANARAIGADNIDIDAGKGNNVLNGNSGKNELSGGAGRDKLKGNGGADKLFGGAGKDKLKGSAGADRLEGGGGSDLLFGGGGKDKFVFASGKDTIKDYNASADKILLDSSALGVNSKSDVRKAATVSKGDITLDFGADELTIKNTTSLNAVLDDISFI